MQAKTLAEMFRVAVCRLVMDCNDIARGNVARAENAFRMEIAKLDELRRSKFDLDSGSPVVKFRDDSKLALMEMKDWSLSQVRFVRLEVERRNTPVTRGRVRWHGSLNTLVRGRA